MFSEVATAATIGVFVVEIAKEIEDNKENSEALKILKKMGRFALTQFEWSTPEWAAEYDRLFSENSDTINTQ
ncbi:MAG TPA: hypothetical protein VJC06_03450 [Candidatus Paceibacterota bacterium]